MSTLETVIQVLNGVCGAEEGEITSDLDLFEEGLLDLEERFGVSLEIGEISCQLIATPEKIAQLIREAQA